MWITYRSGFPRMEPYGYTDDSGWGCMLRSAQMLMIQALQRHALGRSWRVPRTLEERLGVPEYRTLVRLFADRPGEESLFSIHNMCQVGIRYDKLPGEWYGPTTAACVLRDISELYASRLSQRAAARKTPGNIKTGCCSQPEQPPSSSSSSSSLSAKRLRATGGVPGGPPAEGGVCEAEKTAATQDAQGEHVQRGDGRDTGRPAGGAGAGGGGDGGCDGGGSAGAGEDDVDGEGLFPSSRPLRVFVSQGDVVYVDEVEAVAIRGGDAAETAEEDPADGHNCGENTEGLNGNPPGRSGGDGETAQQKSDDANGEERAPPAFFDPLLNPGSSGGQGQEGGAWSSAVLLLVPLRLGLDELSAGYIPSLLETLRVPQSLGFLGGRPNHAIFFIGAQGETLFGLDPHTTQAAPDIGDGFPSERYVHSLHCQSAVSMDVHRVDPSLALAFYLPDRTAFQDLIKKMGETNSPPFSVEQARPDYEGEMGLAFMINQRDDDGTTDDDDDEYVFVKGPER
eukprot:g6178.t1